jgi:F-type H+-transporting ATPase subunit epsilon
MNGRSMHVELVSVERSLWSGEAAAVYARTTEGEIGILPGHAPLLGALAPGWVVRIDRVDEPELRVAVHGGFLSVRADGVSVLAEMAEPADEIDVARARDALSRAGSDQSPEGLAARNRARARLRAASESGRDLPSDAPAV